MRNYGVLLSNLQKVSKDNGVDLDYSFDSLTFETAKGETFNIDFEEGDYSKKGSTLDYRLKSLGITFEQDIDAVYNKDLSEFENDYEFFKGCKLTQMTAYIHGTEDATILRKIKMKPKEIYLNVGGGTIHYKTNKIEVHIG